MKREFSALSGIYSWSEALAGKFTHLKKSLLSLDYLKICCIPVLISLANFNRLCTMKRKMKFKPVILMHSFNFLFFHLKMLAFFFA